jgi:hypothetical protein
MDGAATRPLPALFRPPDIDAFRGGKSEGIPLLMPLFVVFVVVTAVALHSRLILQYAYLCVVMLRYIRYLTALRSTDFGRIRLTLQNYRLCVILPCPITVRSPLDARATVRVAASGECGPRPPCGAGASDAQPSHGALPRPVARLCGVLLAAGLPGGAADLGGHFHLTGGDRVRLGAGHLD